jgi:hypothetical protein
MNHCGLAAAFDRCEPLACWYDPAMAPADNPKSGWGVNYLGVKRR